MSFASVAFIFFYVVVAAFLGVLSLPCFKRVLSNRVASRQWTLLVASYVFCGYYDWRFALSLLGITLVTYFCTLNIVRRRRVRLNLYCGVIVPLLALAFFKYANFFLESAEAAFRLKKGELGTLKVILPIGISFYTFQAISYVVDVSRAKIDASPSFRKVALYMAFFPRLVAGPIVKAGYFLPQLDKDRKMNAKNFEIGAQIFAVGLFKKIVIADRLAPFVDSIYATPVAFHGFTVCLAVLAYALQIYFDFAGYSDMAIGVAKSFGYDLPRNFNFPYLSRNPSEFWKRWHISLSSWLMEYLYIPLGGNRKGKIRTYLNLLTTMLLGGLWHGAGWTFVLWGGLHGSALCVHKASKEFLAKFQGSKDEHASLPRSLRSTFNFIGWGISVVGTFVWCACCLIPFRAESFGQAKTIFLSMFVWRDRVFFVHIWTVIYAIFWIAASVVALVGYYRLVRKVRAEGNADKLIKLQKRGVEGEYPILNLARFGSLCLFLTFVYLTLGFAYYGFSPFVYAQF